MKILSRLLAIVLAAAAMHLLLLAAEPTVSSDAPLLFCIGVHVEPLGAQPSTLVGEDVGHMPPRPSPDYNRGPFFLRHVIDLQALAAIVEKHGGMMTVQVQTPFTSMCVKTGDRILANFEKRGHEIALHFHEDAHLGRNGGSLPVETWTAVMKEEIGWIKKAGATRIRYWSGGNLYPKVLDAAAAAGLEVQSDHKNPRAQRTFPELLSVHPWRPAGGPLAARRRTTLPLSPNMTPPARLFICRMASSRGRISTRCGGRNLPAVRRSTSTSLPTHCACR